MANYAIMYFWYLWLGRRTVSTVAQNQTSVVGSLVELIKVLQEIDTSGPKAEINEQSIDDNNGGRIIL